MGNYIKALILPLLLILLLAFGGCKGGNAKDDSGNPSQQDSTAQNDSTKQDTSKSSADKGNPKKGEDSEALELIPVEVEPAVRGDISQYLLLSASLETEEQVAIYPETGGIIKSFLVEEGDRVEEGDTLLILDDEEKILNRDAAFLDYRESKSEFERAAEMRKQNMNSELEYERAKFKMERNRISYERAELELRRTRVLAPISGYIADRMINRGDLVSMQTQLYSLMNPQDMIAEVHIPEAELPRVNKDKSVKVFSDVFPKIVFNARIKRISPVVDKASGTFRVIVGIHDENEILRPGMFVNVRIVTSVHNNVVLVPKQAVIYENDLPMVYIVKDSTALKVRLHVGFDDNHFVESLKNIEAGDSIVIVGQSGLQDSAMVKIIDIEKIRREAMELAEANGEKLNGKKDKKKKDGKKTE